MLRPAYEGTDSHPPMSKDTQRRAVQLHGVENGMSTRKGAAASSLIGKITHLQNHSYSSWGLRTALKTNQRGAVPRPTPQEIETGEVTASECADKVFYVAYPCYCIVTQVPYQVTLVNTSTILKSFTKRWLLI
jgi:hypothetical protein